MNIIVFIYIYNMATKNIFAFSHIDFEVSSVRVCIYTQPN